MSNRNSVPWGWKSLLLCGFALHAGVASSTPLVVAIDRYEQSAGTNANYFDGRLLTAGDLDSEQSYMLGSKRYLGPVDTPLSELFRSLGLADVLLALDDALLTDDNVSAPTDADSPHLDDMIFLDTDTLTWRGRLYLPGVNGSAGGVYDDLSGTFSGLRQIPEPSSLALLAAAGLVCVKRRDGQWRSLPISRRCLH